MKKKSNLWLLAIALISILFLVILFSAASASKKDIKDPAEKIIPLDEEISLQTEETAEGDLESLSQSVYRDGSFSFTADEFAKQFAGNLPVGYRFADTVVVNPLRDNRIQLEVLDENGTPTDIAIVFNVQESELAYQQMALAIKGDGLEEDAAAMLQWYLSNFLEGFEEELQKEIYEDYLDMFNSRAEDYRVYSEESLTVMMCRETEESENYYYILMSVE